MPIGCNSVPKTKTVAELKLGQQSCWSGPSYQLEPAGSNKLQFWILSQPPIAGPPTACHPTLDDSRTMSAAVDDGALTTGQQCTVWDHNLTPTVRGKAVSTVSTVLIPRMTAGWLYAYKWREIRRAQLSGPQISYAHNRIMQISDMHLSRVASCWKA